jgi:hypothetical protein
MTMFRLSFALVALSTTVCLAQSYYGGGYRGYGYRRYAAGMGNLVQSQGMYNQMTSQAAINMQEAEKLALDNKLKSTQTYFEMRKLNQEATAAERARQTQLSGDNKYVAHTAQPKRLTVSQLDPVSGQINWSPALLQDQFADGRGQLQSIFSARAENKASPDSYMQVRSTVDSMQQQLDTQVKTLHPQDFVNARNFLNALADEARTSGTAVASATR